ncbi:MAG TPA: 30S ribosomal protein S4 [Balneolales bacterium]|nr:30S ribosomal protein S4 [Balneolales bacterium]
MARYRGPKQKKARRFREPIFGANKALERKPYGPGQHGRSRRGKKSEYAIQLEQKQKAKYTYGLLERQFRNLFKKAHSKEGVTGENLLQFLEARLDNTVYRMGFARTRRQARQLVNHRHVVVNGQVVNVPSYSLRPGDVVSIRPRSRNLEVITDSVANSPRKKHNWIEIDKKSLTGKFMNYPPMQDIPENINVQLIVELYSK